MPNLNISIVRGDADKPVIPDLMQVLCRGAPELIRRRMCLRVRDLVAGIAIGRQAEFVCDPLAEMT